MCVRLLPQGGPAQSWAAPKLGAQMEELKRGQLGMGLPEDVDSGPDHSLSLVDRQLSAAPPCSPQDRCEQRCPRAAVDLPGSSPLSVLLARGRGESCLLAWMCEVLIRYWGRSSCFESSPSEQNHRVDGRVPVGAGGGDPAHLEPLKCVIPEGLLQPPLPFPVSPQQLIHLVKHAGSLS